MSSWEALAERKLLEEVADSPEGRSFAYLVGLVEGYGKSFAEEADRAEDIRQALWSEALAGILWDAFDFYERQVEE